MTAHFELDGTTLTVKPEGELDSLTSPAFEKELREHLSGAARIVVDLEKVDYVSSAGIRVFLALAKDSAYRDAELKLIHVNEYIGEVFDLAGFQDAVTVE